MRRRQLSSTGASIAVTLLALGVSAAGVGADPDRTFGDEGVVLTPAGTGTRAVIWDLTQDRSGRLLAAVGADGKAFFAAARYRLNGGLDRSFGSSGLVELTRFGERAEAIAVDGHGRVIIAGYQGNLAGGAGTAPVLARLERDGTLDRSFANNGWFVQQRRRRGGEALHEVTVQPDGRIVGVGARNETRGGHPAALVIRYRPDGGIDRSFGRRGRVLFPTRRDAHYTSLMDVLLRPSGKILVAGYRHGRLFLARLERDGHRDPSFGGGDGWVSTYIGKNVGYEAGANLQASLAVQSDGRIVVQGRSRAFFGVLARYRRDGRLDLSFGRGGLVRTQMRAYDVAVQRGDQIVLCGGGPLFQTMRFRPSGKLDRSFGRNGRESLRRGESSTALSALVQRDGRVLTGGGAQFARDGSFDYSLLLARYLPGRK